MKPLASMVGIFLLLLQSAAVQAGFSQAYLSRLLANKIETVEELAANDAVLRAVREHNARKLALDEIRTRDREWINTNELTPFKQSIQDCEVGRYFRSLVTFQQSIYAEAFLTGNQGATIAAYPITTDYWQGDESKWTDAFHDGTGAVYVGPVEFDKSSKSNSVQIAVPVMDAGRAIGVLIVGVKLSYVQAKYLHRK